MKLLFLTIVANSYSTSRMNNQLKKLFWEFKLLSKQIWYSTTLIGLTKALFLKPDDILSYSHSNLLIIYPFRLFSKYEPFFSNNSIIQPFYT
jgi:hypothetical protein